MFLGCTARVLHPSCCEVCGLITECSHNDDDRQQRGNIYQRMRLTAIPYMYQSSPHHKLSGGCISASGGLFTESENNRFNCIIPVAYVTILDFGMMNGLVTLQIDTTASIRPAGSVVSVEGSTVAAAWLRFDCPSILTQVSKTASSFYCFLNTEVSVVASTLLAYDCRF